MSQAPSGATDKRAAFTLLELLAVITIVALLAGIVLGAGRRASGAGKIARAKAELAALSAALEGYKRSHGDYPRTDDAARLLQSLIGRRGPGDAIIDGRSLLDAAGFVIARPASPDTPTDPFGDTGAVLIDPWSRPYVYAYKVPAGGWTNSGYLLYSPGPDGKDAPALLPGGFPDPAPSENADNLHANR